MSRSPAVRLRPATLLLASLPILLACAWPLLTWPLAPLPPVSNLGYGTREIRGQELGATWRVRVPETGSYRVVFQARSLSLDPASATVEVRDAGGAVVRTGRLVAPARPGFVEVTLEGPRLSLEANRDHTIALSGAEPGFALDTLSLESDSAAPVRLEAEGGNLTPATLVGIERAASGGRWIGVLPTSGSNGSGRESVRQTFRAEANGLDEVIVNLGPTRDRTERPRITVTDVKTGRRVLDDAAPDAILFAPSLHRLRFPTIPDSLGRTYEIALEQPAAHRASVPLGPRDLYRAGELRVDDWRLASELSFVPRYASRWNVLAAVAVVLIVALLAIGFRSPRAGRAALTGVVALVGLVSVATWQREYQYRSPDEFMPDGYGVFAERIRDVLDGSAPDGLARLHADMKAYPHAHNPLTPLAVALATPLSGDVVRAYLVVTFLFSVGSGWLLLLLVEQVPGVTWFATWATWGAAVTHFLFVRAAARTSTDPVGYFFVVLGLLLGVRILRNGATPGALAALIGALTVGLYARLTILPSIPILALILLAASGQDGDPGESRARSWLRRARGPLAVALVPPALFFGSMALAGLLPTFALLGEKMRQFSDGRTPERFLICSAVLVGLFAVPVLFAPVEARQQRLRAAGIAIVIGYLAFLGVTATFWNRHFLHALPGLVLAAAPGVDGLWRRRPATARVWFWASVLLGLGWTAFSLHRGVGVGPPYLVD